MSVARRLVALRSLLTMQLPMAAALARLARLGDFLRMTFYHFFADNGLQHAAALTYTTLLSLVPLMTVTLALLAAFPIGDRVADNIQDFIFQNFVPAAGEVVRAYLQEFAVKASGLSGAGFLTLVVVALLMMSTIEQAFNTIWHARGRRRPLVRFLVYWAVISLGPVLIGVSVAATSYITSLALFDSATHSIGVERSTLLKLMPLFASWVAFSLLYLLVPNRLVPFRHGMAGGLLATLLFEWAKKGFASYITAFPTYEAIYGALAAVPIFLIWIYLSWVVTLLGAEFTYCLGIYRENWRLRKEGPGVSLRLAFQLLHTLWLFHRDGRLASVGDLLVVDEKGSEDIERVMGYLQDAGYVAQTDSGHWLLARDLGQSSLWDLYQSGPYRLPFGRHRVYLDLRVEAGLEQCLTRTQAQLRDNFEAPLSDLFRWREAAPEGSGEAPR